MFYTLFRDSIKRDMKIKKKIGLILLGIVIICWIAVPVLPFFDFPNKAVIITGILVSGEVLFLITIALLGKEYWQKIKKNFKRFFRRRKTKEQNDEI